MITAALVAAAGAAPAAAQSSEALQVHGYLTQGWADATDHGFLGIPVEPTTDYRALALQVRYGFTDESALVLQFSHRRLGTSVLNRGSDDVALDWAFFQHRFGQFSARVGRLPMPRGLYNEVRDVGTLLPFFRAPFNFYTEGVETLDGAALGHILSVAGDWSIESNVFGGAWDYQQMDSYEGTPIFLEARVNDVLGGQLWLLPPVPGVRVGVGGMRFEIDEPMLTGEAEAADGWIYQVSGEGAFDRIRMAAEWERFKPGAFTYDAWYVSGGLRLIDQLWLNGQMDVANLEQDTYEFDYSRDVAAGLSYAFNPRLVVKVEGHEVEGHNLDTAAPLGTPAVTGRYVLISLSAAF